MISSSITGASKEETAISLGFAILSCITGVKDGQKVSKLSSVISAIGISAGDVISNIINLY